MVIFLNIDPPTVTGQMKRVHYVRGKPVFFKSEKMIEAEDLFTSRLQKYAPDEPMEGALFLHVIWYFRTNKSHRHGEWKTTRPDTDNLQKIFKDCMTKVGFWKDDAQVAYEVIEKQWSDRPGIAVQVERLGICAKENEDDDLD